MKFVDYLNAAYPLLWVQTYEECRAIAQLSAQATGRTIYSWDMITGLKDHATNQVNPMKDPLKVIQTSTTLPQSSVLFLKDFHRYLQNIEIIRTLKNVAATFKDKDRHIVVVSPLVNIPIELEKDFTKIEFALPDIDSLMRLARKIIEENKLDLEVTEEAVSYAKGLTLQEAENAIAASIIMTKKIDRKVIDEQKLQTVKKGGLMEIINPIPIDQLGGLDNLKGYVFNRAKGFTDPKLPTPKGILLVGVPGAGKSLSAKVIASVLNVPLIRLDISALKGSLQGQSEERLRNALAQIDAIGFCVLWLDEVEKMVSGVMSSARTDGGTTASMFGTLLTWMQESISRHYIVATCNDVSDLMMLSQGAFIRRFDDVFFVNVPNRNERVEILVIMNKRYNVGIEEKMVDKMSGWTGAEIEKFIIASIYDGTDEALRHIKPISQQNAAAIDAALDWAKANARIANASEEGPAEPSRKLRREV